MRWKFKTKSLMKSVAAGASVFTMCLSPVAQGAAAQDQRKLINQYVKETGLTTKKMTVGEFYRMVRHVYPPKLQKQMDQWVALNRNQMMPAVEASSFKDANGKEQVRLTLTHAGQTSTLTFTGDEENPLKVNGVNFTRKELMNYNKFNALAGKMAKLDPVVAKSLKTGQQKPLGKNFVLTYKEFTRLTARQKAEYFVRLRKAADAAQQVYSKIYGVQALNEVNSKYEWAFNFLFGEEAFAASNLAGKPCIVAGYLSVYGENGSCGGSKSGAEDLQRKMGTANAVCGGNAVSCNPMVYGFAAGGAPHCVSRAEVKYATRACNQKSPLRRNDPRAEGEDKKRIIESYLKKVKGQDINLVLNEEGKISQEQYDQISAYLGDLQNFINQAIGECDVAPLKNIQKYREDQVSACNEIKTRAFSLQSFVVAPEPPGPLPNPNDCDSQKPGSVPGPDNKGCVCPEGTKEGEMDEGNPRPSCLVIETGGEGDLAGGKTDPVPAEDSCGFWCRNKNWIIPVGVGLLALGAFWWLFSKNKSKSDNNNQYIPPAPAPEPEPTATTTVTPAPVDPPPTAPCPAPNQLVNNVCVPVVVVPPPTPESEGGTTTDNSIRAGGVR